MTEGKERDLLLTWTKLVPASEGQDPLGLQLRVTARLGADLLHCITTITPRARYYSMLPWTIMEAQNHFADRKLREAVRQIEKKFTTGCLLHHQGSACAGGGLVGSEVLSPWYEGGRSADTWQKAPFAKNPALDAYFTSLVNFHLFVGRKPSDLSDEIEEFKEWDGVHELTETGRRLVSSYARAIAGTVDLAALNFNAPPVLENLKLWGKAGGLCELHNEAPDRQVLEDLFFNRVDLPEKSHMHRRDSLLLLLYLSHLLTKQGLPLDAETLCTTVYFGSIRNHDGQLISIPMPEALKDTAIRWRMFYFHRYLSYALEYLFSNIVNEANRDRLTGIVVEDWIREWSSPLVSSKLSKLLGIEIDTGLLAMKPRELFRSVGVDIATADQDGGAALDQLVGLEHNLGEHALYELLQQGAIQFTPESCVISTLLCILTVMRYQQWHAGDHGNWLAQATGNAPYENVTVPVVAEDWRVRFGDFWNTPMVDIAQNLIHRFVIRLHLTLAYQKSGAHFYLDEDRVIGRDKHFGSPKLSNPRLRRALQILWDLGLLDDDPDEATLRRMTERGEKVFEEFVGTRRIAN